ncbi:non-ribosomal peptide synthetase [Lysobacter sp. ESA13C]|uniref:non-ribosomal peptide synthetase n=1 Tax=Lysobacter sp. ESA13C TaxID=2862676 RepID=UPI001CC02E6E|nr:non-ribosomal peptide synthetase [Lysobacter sp. ESA13C]
MNLERAIDMERNEDMDAWFPLSAAQQGRWFLYRFDPAGRGNHNNVFAVALQGRIEPSAIARALETLAARHPMLRARVRCLDGREPEQCIAAGAQVPLSIVDAAGLDEDELRARVGADALAAFDDERAPLVRAALYVRDVRDARESVFVLALDHLICDGWSYWRLLEEFGALLSGTATEIEQGAPAAGYRDYVAWQRDWLGSAEAERQFAYWQDRFATPAPVLDLPSDRPRPARPSGLQAVVSLSLSAATTQALTALATRQAGTMFTTLLAAYQILLHRLSGQDDIVVGSPMPGRSRPQWDGVVGDFVNMVALRAGFAERQSVADVLRLARNAALKGMAQQDYPFSRLVDRLHAGQDRGEHPLFQSVFVFQNARRSKDLAALWKADESDAPVAHWGEIGLRPFPLPQRLGSDRIGLALQAMEFDDGLRCDFVYDTDLFDQATVARYAQCFEVLLAAMIADPQCPVARLPLLSAAEREHVLETFNDTAFDYPRERLLHQPFEAQVRATPDATAVVCGDQRLSYAELNRRANRIAHRLLALGVRADDRVALCVERDTSLVAGVLGILKAGAAYVPLDPNYPPDRLAYMLADSAPMALLSQTSLSGLLGEVEVPVLFADDAALADQPEHDPVVDGLTAHHLAYVIYTSGSTGQPKGVAIEHANAANFIAWANANFSAEQLRDTLFSTSINFDLAVYELFAPLSIGAQITVVRDVLATDPSSPLSLINTVPSGINALLQSGGMPATVRTVNLAGEPLKRALVEQIFARTDVAMVANLYGPTETTTYSTWVAMDRADGFASHIGKPVANTRIYIVDAHLEPVPVGVVGELYIGGEGVARGYLHRPELTAERFVRDPFVADEQARMYKTGDLGRWRADGTIEYLGRNDFQVKIRGFRIELGEIETKLAACEGVREAVVVAREGEGGDKRLIAYVVPADGVELTAASLREQLSRSLAEFMLPSAFVTLAALPLTPNGKLDRKALPAPGDDAVIRRDYEAPQGEVETALAQIWCELLGLERVGRHDQFFELGGHSLLALQAVSRIRQTIGVDIALRDLFARPTLSALAAHAEALEAPRVASFEPIAPVARDSVLPLSWPQQRLWFLNQLDAAAGAAYHMCAALHVRGKLDRGALQAALDRVVARHESLRTVFVEEQGEPRQSIGPADTGFQLADHDLRHLDPGSRALAAAEHGAAEAVAPFDLGGGPLIRGRLLLLSSDEHILLFTQHHIISDGWSIGLLVKEVSALYAALRQGQADPLPPLSIQYADYAAWQREQLQGERLRELGEFWRRQLRGAPVLLELPTDRPRPPVQSYAGDSVPLVLPAALSVAVRTWAQGQGATLFMALLAAWSTLLSRLSGQDEVVVGTPVANRQHPQTEPLIGFFVNALALRVSLRDDPSAAQLLARVRAVALDAYEHQDLPFEQVVDALQPARTLSHSPLFQAMLSLDNTPGGATLNLPGLSLSPLATAQTTTRFDLSLALSESGAEIVGELEYATDLFERETIERYAGYFVRLLEAMVADAQAPVARLPLLSADERAHVLETFNDTGFDYPRERLLHQPFEAQVRATPEATAVVCDGERLSYAELNRRANRIAHRLLALGVRADDRVAICLERGPSLVAGVLGILKAGAAYVPLDPNYPPDRLAYMLGDSAPMALLSQASLSGLLGEVEVPVLFADDAALADQPEHDPVVDGLTARHLAYVIYTSGSTGQPKGVAIEHANAANFIAWANANFSGEQLANTLFSTSINFDLAVYELFAPLSIGAQITVVRDVLATDPGSPLSLINTVPSGINALLQSDGVPATVRTVNLAGEPLKRALVEQIFDRTDVAMVANLYGPTETTTYSTWVAMDRADGFASHIGKPVANTRIYIVDAHLEPVPVGVVGELYIGGEGVARGYLHRPELTAERFVRDPFVANEQARMYKTGDLGRWRADGTIEYLGRNDFQVKIRGFRIELGEIETKLAACDGVREAVVVAREGEGGDKRLIAYVVPDDGIELSAASLREQLSRSLAEFMLPSAFVTLAALPLTPNGKLDRKALPAPGDDAVIRRDYEAPQGEVETALAQIWCELLGLERVGRHDQFFELGGSSLVITRLGFEIRQRYGINANVGELYGRQALKDMAAFVEQQSPRLRREADDATVIEFDL